MGKSLREIDALPLPEFRQWQVYATLHPIGPARDDWRIGQLAAMYFNAHRGKGDPPMPLSEFMWQPPREEPDPDKEAQRVRSVLLSLPAPPMSN